MVPEDWYSSEFGHEPQKDGGCGFVYIERVRASRHARQRVGVGRGLLQGQPRVRCCRRQSDRRILLLPCPARGLVGQASEGPAVLGPRWELSRLREQQSRLPAGQNVKSLIEGDRLHRGGPLLRWAWC